MSWKNELLKEYTDKELNAKADKDFHNQKGTSMFFRSKLGFREFYKASRKLAQQKLKNENK